MFLASERFLRNTPGRLRIKFKNDNRDLIVLLEPGGKKIQFFEILETDLRDGPNGKKFYNSILFDMDHKALENTKIKRIEDNDIEITSSNKNGWTSTDIFFNSKRS
jgi:hypothetical protein